MIITGAPVETLPFEDVDYFPSYEIITSPAARGIFFDSNLRTVSPEGVRTAMATFIGAHDGAPPSARPKRRRAAPAGASKADVQCEEAMLEAFAGGRS